MIDRLRLATSSPPRPSSARLVGSGTGAAKVWKTEAGVMLGAVRVSELIGPSNLSTPSKAPVPLNEFEVEPEMPVRPDSIVKSWS